MSEAAEYVGLSRATLYRWIRTGHVKYVVLPNGWTRIPRDEAIRLRGLLG
ncbi:helix-turn-helix domain-containing protein [Dietzia sp. SLG510A3-3B2-2]|nr:helix-turn-helix domain-containing protein [Dietzia sp. SLG510A3-3B2-2]